MIQIAIKTLALLAFASASVACLVVTEDGGSRRGGSGGRSSMSGGDDAAGTDEVTPPAAADTKPMLAKVDTGKTMTASPGDGVGVFTEYSAGGKWRVWWTCDTHPTGKSCDVSVKVTMASGAIREASSSGFGSGDALASPSSQSLQATTLTTTRVSGVSFETEAGATITLDATVGGLKDGQFLFFVQDGKVNGGFDGRLTNPLMLVGARP